MVDKTNKIPVMQELFRGLVVAGRDITVDTLLKQRAIVPSIMEGDCDYVMLVKGSPPQFYHNLHLVFHDTPIRAEPLADMEMVDAGHGRLDPRRLTTLTVLMGYRDWPPGLAQVFHPEGLATRKGPGEQHHAVVYGVTSHSLELAEPERMLRLVHQYWQSKNQVPWVLEATFDEDRSQVWVGRIPQHGDQLNALVRGSQYCGRLSPLCSRAMVGFSPDRHVIGKLTGLD